MEEGMADEGNIAVLEAPAEGTIAAEGDTTSLPQAEVEAVAPVEVETVSDEDSPEGEVEAAAEPKTYTEEEHAAALKDQEARLTKSVKDQATAAAARAQEERVMAERNGAVAQVQAAIDTQWNEDFGQVAQRLENTVFNVAKKAADEGFTALDIAGIRAYVQTELGRVRGSLNTLTGGAFAHQHVAILNSQLRKARQELGEWQPTPEAAAALARAQTLGDVDQTTAAMWDYVAPAMLAKARREVEAEFEREKGEAAEAAKLKAADDARTKGGRPSNVSGTAGKLNTNPTWAELQKMSKAQLAALPDAAIDAAMKGANT